MLLLRSPPGGRPEQGYHTAATRRAWGENTELYRGLHSQTIRFSSVPVCTSVSHGVNWEQRFSPRAATWGSPHPTPTSRIPTGRGIAAVSRDNRLQRSASLSLLPGARQEGMLRNAASAHTCRQRADPTTPVRMPVPSGSARARNGKAAQSHSYNQHPGSSACA